MTVFLERLRALSAQRFLGMRCGIEKESLRVQASGALALTPHPQALGSALTHPHITTDFSESQLELITGVHDDVEACLQQLTEVHQLVYQVLHEAGGERLWVSSMPCELPADSGIPIGRYGSSNVGRAKSVYRAGLGCRYGRRMQTISGIHYNWSLPGVTTDQYFGLIRNFRRHAFLLLYLFGASPAVCTDFVAGQAHELYALGPSTMYMPYATSLRMGRLGYQSDAQATLAVSYNSLEGYGASLQEALTRPYPLYEAIGLRDAAGDYKQLSTSLLQIENEFYSTIRPKRVIFPGERPLHALRERGVEYIEVRLLDLNPFMPVGIDSVTLRFINLFLLHSLLSDSPPDTPQEIAALVRNQKRVAARGRKPGLTLECAGAERTLHDWAQCILDECVPIARALDAAHGHRLYSQALEMAGHGLAHPESLPSARVLQAMREQHAGSFSAFTRARSVAAQYALLARPFEPAQRERFDALAHQSRQDQSAIEAADTLPFDQYLQHYLSVQRLGLSPETPAAPAAQTGAPGAPGVSA